MHALLQFMAQFRFGCAALLLVMFSVAAQAQYITTSDGNGGLIITAYAGSAGSVIIPATISGLPVTCIGANVFGNINNMTSVTIPSSVSSIGANAFSQCISLTSITVSAQNSAYSSVNGVLFNHDQTTLIQYPAGNAANSYTVPGTVTSIGDNAFAACQNLASVTIPNSVTSVGNYAFAGITNLTSVTIPDSVTSIGADAFELCSALTDVTIGKGVTSIGAQAFNCHSLTSITVSAQNSSYSSLNGVLFNSNQTTLIQYPASNAATSYTVPSTVTSIGDYAFISCYALTSVTLPNSLTSIGIKTFYNCHALTDVTLPDGLTSIGDVAFGLCFSLTNVTIPGSVTSIGSSVFISCTYLTSITVSAQNSFYSSVSGVLFDSSQTTLVEYPAGRSGGSYTIPHTVTNIGDFAFGNCYGLTSITIPSGATRIGEGAFSSTNLANITIPNSVTSIGDEAFQSCTSLTSIGIPNAVTSIGFQTFLGCGKLTRVTIGNNVTTIGQYAFEGCTSLASITIPNSVTSIGLAAFDGCASLASAVFQGNAPTMGGYVFQGTASGFTVTYYDGATGFSSPTWTPDVSDSYPAVETDPFSGSSLGSGWYYSSWFGTYNSTYYPWINDASLGFIYVSSSDQANLYLYVLNGNSGSMGWLYTTQALFPSVYSFSEGAWLWYGGGTSFYNFSTAAWETY